MSRIQPLDDAAVVAAIPGMADARGLPTSYRTLAHRPQILSAFQPLYFAIMWQGTVDLGLKQMVAHMVSSVAGCRYCQAHTGHIGVERAQVPAAKMARLWEFETDPEFSDAERAALRLARDSAIIPNAVTDGHIEELRKHFSEAQIVEIIAAASIFGFLNRYNDTLANTLEEPALDWAAGHLPKWEPGKHAIPR